jgi:hypothetical protein
MMDNVSTLARITLRKTQLNFLKLAIEQLLSARFKGELNQ